MAEDDLCLGSVGDFATVVDELLGTILEESGYIDCFYSLLHSQLDICTDGDGESVQ